MKKDLIAIVGTGMIASSTAVLTTGHGHPTIVLARSEASAEKMRRSFDDHWATLVREHILSAEQADVCKEYLTVTTRIEDLAPAEYFFEAVLEDVAAKQSVYRALAASCPKIRFIGTMSSAMTVDVLSKGLDDDPDRPPVAGKLIVTHPFNPVHIIPYVELCAGEQTEDGLLQAATDLLTSLDRVPVVLKKATPGFIGNRLQFALFREAMALVEQGVCDFRDIDKALMYSFCPRYTSIGLFEHLDAAGLALDKRNFDFVFPYLSTAQESPDILNDRLAEGKEGIRSGEGFYDWRGVDMDAYAKRVNAPFLKFCQWDFPETNP